MACINLYRLKTGEYSGVTRKWCRKVFYDEGLLVFDLCLNV